MKFYINVTAEQKSGQFVIEAESEDQSGSVAAAFLDQHWPAAQHPIKAVKLTQAPDDATPSEGVDL